MTTLLFRALEASNPLAFLAALGALRLSSLAWPTQNIKLRWIRDNGLRPELSALPSDSEEHFCSLLHQQAPWAPLDDFSPLGNNITVPRELFQQLLRSLLDSTSPIPIDFAAAFGSDIFHDKEKNRIDYTDLCFITGSGHQHFLGTVRSLAQSAGPGHLHEALFGPWRYADKGLSLRWDPDDAKEYALRWRDPSIGGVSSVWGANRLAFEALPLFPTVPTATGLRTTGFHTRNRAHEFTWPVWDQPASLDTVRSLLSLRELQTDSPDRSTLHAMGISEIFRVQRVRIGQGANFKVSFRPARSI